MAGAYSLTHCAICGIPRAKHLHCADCGIFVGPDHLETRLVGPNKLCGACTAYRQKQAARESARASRKLVTLKPERIRS